MPKSWVAALISLLVVSGCTILDDPEASPTAEAVAGEPAPAPEVAAEARPASAEGGDAETDEVVEEGGRDASEQETAAAGHPELGALYPVVSVYDGDTIAVTVDGVKERVRIIGIDAPELARYGNPADCFAQESASQMQSLVQSQQVYLLPDPTQADRDRYDRLLRHVVLDDADSSHVALQMVEGGYAVERQYAAPYQYQPDLLAAQDRARSAGLGLWTACAAPAPGPAPEPAPAPAPTEPAPVVSPVQPAPPATKDCVIKGNVASDGERIYHVPGQRHYDDTVISPEKGERWFCTEQEAVDAGWRKAKV